MIRIDRIKIPVPEKEGELKSRITRILKMNKAVKGGVEPRFTFEILKRSLDARKKPELFYIYSVAVTLESALEEKLLKYSGNLNMSEYTPVIYNIPKPSGHVIMTERPVIVGSGPAGLFCAYILCLNGYSPLILERGGSVDERSETVRRFWNTGRLDPDSNVQFGEGGAGTFSDGKLNTGVNDRAGRNRFVLDTFINFGAPSQIAYENRPHLGTDMLVDIVRSMRKFITGHGGSIKFNTRFTRFEKDSDGICAVYARHKGSPEEMLIKTNCLILATGHSARDTFKMLHENGIGMQPKNFAVGLRIQHPLDMINTGRYGENFDPSLPSAEYKMTYHARNGRDVYTFCMCPGGYVINASSEPGMLAVNGMSYSGRDARNSNSAIIVSVGEKDFGSDDPLAGMYFQRKLEETAYGMCSGRIPVQKYGDYKANTISSDTGKVIPCMKGSYGLANLRSLFSEDINSAIIESIDKFGYTIEGFDREDSILAGVESRTSSPLRILRDESFMANIPGMFPCGEGAGYAGGITSAAMDGIRVAEKILERYAPARTFRMCS
ncbi:MAG: FAD-dependent oxidoreductase [Lachnospiraceae bacterium]|nr:FAD-dependent oxidoreductase [Lachnospiraceae bacterium]